MNIQSTFESKDFQNEIYKALKPIIARTDYIIELLEGFIKKGGKDFYTVKEFAEVTLSSQKTVRNHIKAGSISYHQEKEGTKIKIPSSEILKFKQL